MTIYSSPILLAFAGEELDLPALSLPNIMGFIPETVTYGSGLLVTGTGFWNATEIRINGLTLNDFEVLSDTAVFGTIPWMATTGPIEVINPLGTDTSLLDCIVDPNNIYEWFRLYAQPEDFLFKL
jgi:hypothetical protein